MIRHRSRSPFLNPMLYKRMLQTGVFLALFFMVGYGGFWLHDSAHFPISSVNLVAEREHVSLNDLKTIILPEAQSGFFRLEVDVLQQQLLSLPWMKHVGVRRVWPDRLEIRFEEYIPVARWGDQGLISEEGKIFFPDHELDSFSDLPQLIGPEGKSDQLWQMYLTMNKILARDHLSIARLELAPRGAWHCHLSNGIQVVLGTQHVLDRFNQFLMCYENNLQSRAQEIAYVDLRYTRGMALGWKGDIQSMN